MNNVSKSKKLSICIGCIFILYFLGFATGRAVRFKGVSESGRDLEQSITGISNGVDRIENGINNVGDELTIMQQRNEELITRVNELETTVESIRSINDECVRIIEDGEKSINECITDAQQYLDTIDLILRIAEIKADQNERTIERLNELLNRNETSTTK